MSDFYCDMCDGTIKWKYILKQLTTKFHIDLAMSVVNRYCFINPTILRIEDTLKKHVFDYNKGFGFFFLYVNGN